MVKLVLLSAALVTVGSLWSPARSQANPTPSSAPVRICTRGELRTALGDSTQGRRVEAATYLGELCGEERDLMIEALVSPAHEVRVNAMLGLAQLGDSLALSAIRSVLLDPAADPRDVCWAAEALARARDVHSLSAIREVAEMTDKEWLRRGLSEAVDLLRNPDLARPLVVHSGGYVFFRFLLDDIATIYIPWGEAQYARLTLNQEDHRQICDMLQNGVLADPGVYEASNHLVIELRDGRRAKIVWHGDCFCVPAPSVYDDIGFCTRSTELAQYLTRALGATLEAVPGLRP